MFDFLKKVPLFADLPAEDFDRLCAVATEENLTAGEILFTEGDIGDKTYVIMAGEIDILKESGGRMIFLATRKVGDVIGEMSLIDQAPRFATGRAQTNCKLLSISHENFEHLLNSSPSAARVLLLTISDRLRSTELVLRQSEKMAQLGTLTAGIAHELNNPASAALRGSEHLNSAINQFQRAYQLFHEQNFSQAQWDKMNDLRNYVNMRASQPIDLVSLDRSDREDEIETWLNTHKVEKNWEFVPILVNMGYRTANLEELEVTYPGPHLAVVLSWMCSLFNIFSLLEVINQGTSRIGEIVKALKSYTYLDQAPVQPVDIHESLDNTLVILRSKLITGITLERNYAGRLPKIMAYGGELNQVWTNIIANAVDAVDGKGTIKISTRRVDDWILVEIEDSGPGIPEDVKDRLFSPFFTTKPIGKGTGLGLNISFNIIQKHKGFIDVTSQPGRTCFSVRLPINFEQIE